MDDLFDIAKSIGEKLKSTDLYNEYITSKNNILKDPELNLKVYRYKKLNFEYQSKIINGFMPAFDEERRISTIYWELVLNKDAKAFLESEKKLVELINSVYNIIGDSCEIGMFTELYN